MRRRAFLKFAFMFTTMVTNGANSNAQQAQGNLLVEVRSDSRPVEQVDLFVR